MCYASTMASQASSGCEGAQVNEGTVDVDQSALTGESLPVTIRAGGPAMMGGTIVRGEVCQTPLMWAGEFGRI